MRLLPVILSALIAFTVTAALTLRFMPEPLKDTDYFIAGSLATVAALLVMFFTLVGKRLKSGDVFFKKRPKQK